MSNFGLQLRKYRLDRGLSQEELAEEIGISRNYLSQIERGVSRNFSLVLARKLQDRIGLQVVDEPTEHPIPDSLRKLAREENIESQLVRVLAGIEYRGHRPETLEEWKLLYLAVLSATGSRR